LYRLRFRALGNALGMGYNFGGYVMDWQTKVRLIVMKDTYACISECGAEFHIKLAPNKKAATALRDYAEEQRARAACIIANAEIAERAALVWDQGEAERIAKIK
jgi:hypothetical protein